MQFEYPMAAVVAAADGDGFRVEEGEEGVEGGEAGGVGYAGCFEEGGQDGFEARGVCCRVAGVDVLFVSVGVRFVEGLEAGRVSGIAVCGGDVDGRRDILDYVQLVVGVDCEGGWLEVELGEAVGLIFKPACGWCFGDVVSFDIGGGRHHRMMGS